MRRFCCAVLLLCLLPLAGARAAGYDDFAHGVTANAQGQRDAAIGFFSAAIAAGDLSPALLPEAYRGRGTAYFFKKQCGEALADADRALQLKPGTAQLLWLHAAAAECAGKLDLALADYTALILLNEGVDPFWKRGHLLWRKADYGGAAADFAQVVRLKPDYAYGVLWLDVTRARAGMLDPAAAISGLQALPGHDWPQPVIAVYAGRAKPDDVAAAVAQGGKPSVADRQCEADFYLAEWWLGQKDEASARPLLERAAAQCTHDYIEYSASSLELERLK